ncbi:MAG: methionyl-tRNA formyltransferase [Alphaproteobacteria bacterium]|nr:MAG: methionyl-tRNA formyltransferase [Alphaproteobacteria bacterium]
MPDKEIKSQNKSKTSKASPTQPLRVVFMGTPDFAVPSLVALLQKDTLYEIVGVFTQPPRPANRGQKPQKSPVHLCAEDHNLTLFTPEKLSPVDAYESFCALAPDVCVVVAYGALLPQRYLDVPTHGCINVHGSLLPRWRGASPIHASVIYGDTEGGITIMEMVRELDAGDMLAHVAVPITPKTTAGEFHDVLCHKGAEILTHTLARYCAGNIIPVPQDHTLATYSGKLTKESGRIDWTQSASFVDRHIRGHTPWPGAWFTYDGVRIKVLKATPVITLEMKPGEISPDSMHIGCRGGAMRLETVQRAGKEPQDIIPFLRGFPMAPGSCVIHSRAL